MHLSQLELRVLEIGDGVVERLAVRGVVDRPFQRRLACRDRAHRLHQTFLRQLGHQLIESAALLAQQIGHGHADIIEEQFGRVGRLVADLLEQPPPPESRAIGLDQNEADALGLLFRDRSCTASTITSAPWALVMYTFCPLMT